MTETPRPPPDDPAQRVRSPDLDRALAANSDAAILAFLHSDPDGPFADDARRALAARRMR